MLTRIEIDGFKTFEGFCLDIPPFLVNAGPNSSGKSNFFDAIQLLSALAHVDLRSAVTSLRGDPTELFRRSSEDRHEKRIQLAAEVLLEPRIRDPWGAERELIQTRLRYEVTIERREDEKGLERLYVVHEAALPIRVSDDSWVKEHKPSAAFRSAFLAYRRISPLLETSSELGGPAFRIAQDGNAGRLRPAIAAEATVLSSITSAEFTHLYALREELRSWRFLQLDPAALREPSSKQSPDRLEPSGGNLASVLARIKAETATPDDEQGLLADVSADLAQLIPGVTAVEVEEDARNNRWEVIITKRDEPSFSARVASDGTLRLLALLTVLNDPVHGGLICFEEPENGVHPARLRGLIEHLRQLVSDPALKDANPDLPMVQLVLTTHSPVVVASVQDGEAVFFDSLSTVDPRSQSVSFRTNARPVRASVQDTLTPDEVGRVATRAEVDRYLSTASGR